MRKVSYKRIWIDVGSHLGEKSLEAARKDPKLLVLAFEPQLSIAQKTQGILSNYINMPVAISETDGFEDFHFNKFPAASSLLPINISGYKKWIGREKIKELRMIKVPTMRLDTIMKIYRIGKVEFIKIDTQGADLSVVKSLGKRIFDIDKIELEVDITSTRLYLGSASKENVISFMSSHGFSLALEVKQSFGQEENLTFIRVKKI